MKTLKFSKSWRAYLYGHLAIATTVFVIFVSSLMARYVFRENEKIKAETLAYAVEVVNEHASKLDLELRNALDVSRIAAKMVELGDTSPVEYMASASTLNYVEHVCVINSDGIGIDENGLEIDLSGIRDIFEVSEDSEGKIIKNPTRTNSGSMMGVVASKAPDGEIYYSVSMNKDSTVNAIFASKTFDGLTTFLIVDKNGNVLYHMGGNSELAKYDNVWDVLDEDSEETSRIRGMISKNGAGYGEWESGRESRQLIVAPILNNNLSLVAAVNNSYIDYKTNKDSEQLNKFRNYMTAAIVIFIMVLGGILVMYTIKFSKTNKQLEEKADTDLLTGLNNKLATERKIKHYITTHPDTPCMVMLFDIDNFKKINDTKGHAFGDEVIRTLGQSISGQFRVTDIIGRVGGDEFMVFLKNIPNEEIAIKEATKLMYFFKDFAVGGYVKYSATASVGAAMFPENGTDFESIYKAADAALYRSKQNGRNQLNFNNEAIPTIRV